MGRARRRRKKDGQVALSHASQETSTTTDGLALPVTFTKRNQTRVLYSKQHSQPVSAPCLTPLSPDRSQKMDDPPQELALDVTGVITPRIALDELDRYVRLLAWWQGHKARGRDLLVASRTLTPFVVQDLVHEAVASMDGRDWRLRWSGALCSRRRRSRAVRPRQRAPRARQDGRRQLPAPPRHLAAGAVDRADSQAGLHVRDCLLPECVLP